MKLIQLSYLLAVSEEGSFSGAARRCRVSQPTISNAVGQLEEELGAKLLRRTTRKVELTPFGRHLLPLAQAALTAVEELKVEAERFRNPERKLLRLGFSPVLDMPRMMRSLEPFHAEHPDLELIFKECTAADMEERLNAQTLDILFGLGAMKSSARGRCLLYKDPIRYLPRGGLEGRLLGSSIELAEVARARLVLTAGTCGLRKATLDLLAKGGFRPDLYPGQAMSYPVLQEWTELGIGGAMIPESKIDGASRFPAVMRKGRPIDLRIEAIWRKDALVTPHHQALVRYLKRSAPSLLSGAL